MLRLSLRQLVLGTLLVFAVVVASGQFVFILYSHAKEAQAGLEAVIRHAGATLAANVEMALDKGDEGYVEHLLDQQASLPNLVHAALVGSDELIVGSTIPRIVSRAPQYANLAPPSALVRAARAGAGAQMSHEADTDRLWGVFPVRFPTAPDARAGALGYVVLLVDTAAHERAALHQALIQSAVLLLPLVLLSLLLGFMVKRVLTDRIERLLDYMRSQVRGTTSPAPVSGRDELGQLGTALSALMKEVLDSRDYHVRLLERMPNPIWRAGPDGQCTYFNAAWLAFTGRAQAREALGGWLEGVHPDDLAACRAAQAHAMEQREPFSIEFRLRKHNGDFHWFRQHGSPLFGREGEFIGYIGSSFDIQGVKDAAAELKAATEVVEASPTVLFRWRLEPGWPVCYVSENVRRWGYTRAAMLAPEFRFVDLIHPDDVERVLDEVGHHLASGTTAYVQAYRLRLASGDYIWIEDLTRAARAADGAALFVEGLVTDISARKAAEERVRQLNAELELRVAQRTAELAMLNKELETFAYSVSHDLKAPLRGIDGYSHLLLEDHGPGLDEEGRLFVHNIRAGVRQMAVLIDDLLAYSRVERRSLQRLEVRILPVVEGILAERAAEVAERGARVEIDVPDLAVRADPDGLALVLRNLVDNALKYARDSHPPQIRIQGRAAGEVFHLSVQDNGIGFDMKFHDRIFEIFQRLQRAEDYAGTGVGLAIVRKAVQRMGGRVWAESAPGVGATFHLEMPL